MSRCGDMAIWN